MPKDDGLALSSAIEQGQSPDGVRALNVGRVSSGSLVSALKWMFIDPVYGMPRWFTSREEMESAASERIGKETENGLVAGIPIFQTEFVGLVTSPQRAATPGQRETNKTESEGI